MSVEAFEFAMINYVLPILLAFGLAYVTHILAKPISRRLVEVTGYIPQPIHANQQRRMTLNGLIASIVTLIAFLIAFLFTLGRFMDTTSIVWMIGLFSASFGLGAKPLIGDFLMGMSFIFEDTFSVGEKVEIGDIQGIVEKINLRTTFLRSITGELYVVPNEQIRIIRNFSRGSFSMANITLKVSPNDLKRTIEVLEAMANEAVDLLPNLVEPWQVITESGVMGTTADLTLVTKARFGMAAEMRPRLLALVHDRLEAESITSVG